MNKFFLFGTIACAALTFASCSNSELSASEENAPKAIGFDVYQGRMPVTRAATDGTSIQTSGFGVLASRTSGDGDWTSSATPNFLYNQKVTYSNSNWTYTPTKYWPTNSDKISFWAYAPYAENNANISLSNVSATGAPKVTITLPTTPNPADLDFVAACAMNKTYSGTTNGSVAFTLKHEMTRAAFKIEAASNFPSGATLKMTKVELSGTKLYSSAIYTFPTTDDRIGTWARTDGNSNTITLTEDVDQNNQSGYLYLIPVESLGDREISVEVSYTVTLPGDAPVSKTTTVYIPAGGLKQGKSYLYTFTYDIEDSGSGFHPISFSATVTPWDSDTTENLVQQ